MNPNEVKRIVGGLDAGNNSFRLLLNWGAKVAEPELLGVEDPKRVADVVIGRVNQVCGTTIKRADLAACPDYWKSVGKSVAPIIESRALQLRRELVLRKK